METKRNCYDVLDEVISPDNVMNIGELIALKTVQRLVLIKAPRSRTLGSRYGSQRNWEKQSVFCYVCGKKNEVLHSCMDARQKSRKHGKSISKSVMSVAV